MTKACCHTHTTVGFCLVNFNMCKFPSYWMSLFSCRHLADEAEQEWEDAEEKPLQVSRTRDKRDKRKTERKSKAQITGYSSRLKDPFTCYKAVKCTTRQDADGWNIIGKLPHLWPIQHLFYLDRSCILLLFCHQGNSTGPAAERLNQTVVLLPVVRGRLCALSTDTRSITINWHRTSIFHINGANCVW